MKFRDQTLGLFAAGEVEIISTTLDGEERKGCELMLQKMLYHAGKFDWNYVLDLYAAVIKSIEFGAKSWGDNFQELEHMILGMRPYASQVDRTSRGYMGECKQSQTQQGNKTHKVMFCAGYQTGDCKEAEVHQSYVYNRLFTVRHFCVGFKIKR